MEEWIVSWEQKGKQNYYACNITLLHQNESMKKTSDYLNVTVQLWCFLLAELSECLQLSEFLQLYMSINLQS